MSNMIWIAAALAVGIMAARMQAKPEQGRK